MSSIQSSLQSRFQMFYTLRPPMKGSHSTVLLQSRSMVHSKRVYSRKNVDRNFCVGQGPLPIHIKVERRISPEAFVKKQYRIFSIFDLESLRTLSPSLRNIWIFCTQQAAVSQTMNLIQVLLLHTPDNHMWWPVDQNCLCFLSSCWRWQCSVPNSSPRPHGLQHTKLLRPSLPPRVCSNPCWLSW